eukprot:TRINITY_DN1460_c0_g1_i2.p1 TRINITY_DN1460_c0_g1~~TRINITY_DN1460_c0_g1_i2.p1  ORF type:complete len:376 (+),score=-19.55 TRINITY_DN1460_c0_g1_i2:781-1908(+)
MIFNKYIIKIKKCFNKHMYWIANYEKISLIQTNIKKSHYIQLESKIKLLQVTQLQNTHKISKQTPNTISNLCACRKTINNLCAFIYLAFHILNFYIYGFIKQTNSSIHNNKHEKSIKPQSLKIVIVYIHTYIHTTYMHAYTFQDNTEVVVLYKPLNRTFLATLKQIKKVLAKNYFMQCHKLDRFKRDLYSPYVSMQKLHKFSKSCVITLIQNMCASWWLIYYYTQKPNLHQLLQVELQTNKYKFWTQINNTVLNNTLQFCIHILKLQFFYTQSHLGITLLLQLTSISPTTKIISQQLMILLGCTEFVIFSGPQCLKQMQLQNSTNNTPQTNHSSQHINNIPSVNQYVLVYACTQVQQHKFNNNITQRQAQYDTYK